ncbi:MAG: hypothetical protein PUD68_04240 [Clostridiales bacterium]|nr:hypothetical protein [Clostridiales bacterium]
MKILVFSGSPKKVKSDTMTRAFLDGMRDAEAQDARGAIDAGLLEQIASPMIPEDVYANIANGGV